MRKMLNSPFLNQENFLNSDLVTDTTAVHTAFPCGIQQTETLTSSYMVKSQHRAFRTSMLQVRIGRWIATTYSKCLRGDNTPSRSVAQVSSVTNFLLGPRNRGFSSTTPCRTDRMNHQTSVWLAGEVEHRDKRKPSSISNPSRYLCPVEKVYRRNLKFEQTNRGFIETSASTKTVQASFELYRRSRPTQLDSLSAFRSRPKSPDLDERHKV